MFSVPVILLIVATVVGVIGIIFAIVDAVKNHTQPSNDAPEQVRWGEELGFHPDEDGVLAAIAQWEHGPAVDGGLSEPKDPAAGEFAGHPALIFAQDDGCVVAVQRDTASSVVVEIHPQPGEESDESGKATDLQVYSSDVDAMIRATDERLVEILDNHPADLAMAWSEGYWSAALLPLDDDGVDVEINPDDKINEQLPYVLNWLANLNDALRVLPPKEGEEESLSLQGVGPTRPLADRTDADSVPADADYIEPEDAGLVPSAPVDEGTPVQTVSDGSLAGLVAGGAGLSVVGDQPVAPIWDDEEAPVGEDTQADTEEADLVDNSSDIVTQDYEEPITEEELVAAVAADESVAVDDDNALLADDEELKSDELDTSGDNVIFFPPAASPLDVAGGQDDLTVVPDLAEEEPADAGVAEDSFVTLPAYDEETDVPAWAPEVEHSGETAEDLFDESALLDSSWEPQERVSVDALSEDDNRDVDDSFVTEADFAEADRLIGEERVGEDHTPEDAEEIEDEDAALAAYAEAEAVDTVDEFPGETEVETVPDSDSWITPASADYDVVSEPDEATANLAAVDDDEPVDVAEDGDLADFSSEDLAEDGLTEDDLITEDDEDENLAEDLAEDEPEIPEDYQPISEPPHFEGQDADWDIEPQDAPEHTNSFAVIAEPEAAEPEVVEAESVDEDVDEPAEERVGEPVEEPVEQLVGEPVEEPAEETRPRISFVKPAQSPSETGPLPVVNPTVPYYPDRDDDKQQEEDSDNWIAPVAIPQPQEPTSTGSHAARDGELSTMQTGQFPIIRPEEKSDTGRHVREDGNDSENTRPAWFVPGKATSHRSHVRDEDDASDDSDSDN